MPYALLDISPEGSASPGLNQAILVQYGATCFIVIISVNYYIFAFLYVVEQDELT